MRFSIACHGRYADSPTLSALMHSRTRQFRRLLAVLPLVARRMAARSAMPALMLLSSTAAIRAVHAQSAAATIDGRVTNETGQAIPSAVVSVRNTATGFETQSRADAKGLFTLRQLPLGGPYLVTVRAIGHRAEQRTGIELALNDRISLSFRLSATAAELAPLVVAADASNTRIKRVGSSTLISANDVKTLPVANRDFANLTAITPLASGTNLGGAKGTSTAFQVDGASVRQNRQGVSDAGGGAVMTIEAIREFEVATNDYDVVQGRQGGGAITAATKFGTNTFEGSAFAFHRNEALTTANYVGRPADEFSLYQYGASAGGPIVRDRLHFFVAGERREQTSPSVLFDLRNLEDEKASLISRDSLSRFLDIIGRVYGTDIGAQQVGSFTLPVTNDLLFTRLDWQLSQRHRLTLRNNYVSFDGGDLTGPGPGIYEAKGRETQRTNTTALALRSTLSSRLLNEATLQFTDVTVERTPNAGYLPVGLVRVRSTLSDGTATNRQIQFGGNRNMPANLPERQLQFIDKAVLELGNATFTLGTDNVLSMYTDEFVAQEQLGRFEFNSLAELETRRPNRFVRQVPLLTDFPSADQTMLDAALFGQVEFRPHSRVTANLGVRYDVSFAFKDAAFNPVAESTLGIRTDTPMPVDWNNVLPRAQFTWDVRGDGREILRIGGGAFTANPHHAPFYNSILFNGTQLADINVTGALVPRPDYASYRADPTTIPGVPTGVTAAPAQVELIGKDYQLPFTWKANLAYSRTLFNRLTLGANAVWSRTSNNYQIFNRNLVAQPFFTIEGGRPVFVPAASIPTTGVVNAINNRVTQQVAEVFELTSQGRAEQKGIVLEAGLRLPRRSSINASLTFSDARDNNAWNCCLSGTSANMPVKGDPRDIATAWGTSLWNVGQKAIIYGTLPSMWGFQVSGRYVGSSGAPYSLLVNADINGDGVLVNDLAYVFDPSSSATPAAVATSMRKVLDNPANLAADCIRSQLGRIADRTSCRSPWEGRIDLRVSKTINTWRGQNIEIMADLFNVASIINRNWGGTYSIGDINLMTVSGFNRTTQRFDYVVNESAGVTRKGGAPYQIQLGARYGF
jgi:hypothetical protein